jgi:hypothetical protein
VLVHFETFDEVNWPKRLGVESVRLLLAPSVMRELDKFKDDASNDWRQTRTRTLLTKLRALLTASGGQAAQVRPGVTILDLPYEPNVDWGQLGLDPHQEDDRLIASILQFLGTEPGTDVLLITNDFPLERKARRQSIPVRNVEEFISRIETRSEKDRTIRDLQTRLASLEERVPKLSFRFAEGGKRVNSVTRSRGAGSPNRPTDEELEDHINQQRSKIQGELDAASGRVDEDELDEYREEAKHYLIDQRVVVYRRRARNHDLRMVFSFVLENHGASIAEDVAVTLQFPSGSFAVSEEDENSYYDGFKDLKIRKPPVPRWHLTSRERVLLTPLHPSAPSSRTYPDEYAQADVPTGPYYFDDRSKLLFLHPKLRPTKCWETPSIALFLPPCGDSGFQVAYEIQAVGLSEPQTGRLHVRLV